MGSVNIKEPLWLDNLPAAPSIKLGLAKILDIPGIEPGAAESRNLYHDHDVVKSLSPQYLLNLLGNGTY